MRICEDIKSLVKILGPRFSMNYPLSPLTSLKIGGSAEFLASANNLEELDYILTLAKREGLRTRILGRGTDLVIQDGLLKGITVQLAGTFRQIKRYNGDIIMGGGCPISLLIKEAIKGNLQGAEGLAGIPGTLGGGVMMNAGTHLGTLGDLVKDVDILKEDNTVDRRKRQDMGFSYRSCTLGNREIILGARLKLSQGSKAKEEIKKALMKKLSHQPYKEKTAGCVFLNPEGQSAGRLIDEAGLKGVRCGDIEVSRKHANFFINLGRGTASDFMHLMDIVHSKVFKTFGVDLKPEVRIWVN